MELHIIAAWVAFALSVILPIALGYYASKKSKRTPDPLLGVVLPRNQQTQRKTNQ